MNWFFAHANDLCDPHIIKMLNTLPRLKIVTWSMDFIFGGVEEIFLFAFFVEVKNNCFGRCIKSGLVPLCLIDLGGCYFGGCARNVYSVQCIIA